MIKIDNIAFAYNNDKQWLFNMNIKPFEKVALMGKSGSGKSTLFKLIAGLLPITAGNLYLNGILSNDLPPHKRHLSFLFQNDNLFNHLTVLDNIKIGLSPNLRITPHQTDKILSLAKLMEIETLFHKYPEQLSGGQVQRVALARVFAREQPILLLDEPFSALDKALKLEVIDLLNNLCSHFQTTLFMITHDITEATALQARIIELK
jgi:thiamine transport system ATP-binding protein